MTNLELAILFHETYERLAPSFHYSTRHLTRKFDPDSPNGRLMIAVCGEVFDRYDAATTVGESRVEPSDDRCAHRCILPVGHNGKHDFAATALTSSPKQSAEPELLREGDCAKCGRHWTVSADADAVVSVLAVHCICGHVNK